MTLQTLLILDLYTKLKAPPTSECWALEEEEEEVEEEEDTK